MECCNARSCLSIWLKIAQMLRCVSQGFEVISCSSTAESEKFRFLYSISNALRRYVRLDLNLFVLSSRELTFRTDTRSCYMWSRVRNYLYQRIIQLSSTASLWVQSPLPMKATYSLWESSCSAHCTLERSRFEFTWLRYSDCRISSVSDQATLRISLVTQHSSPSRLGSYIILQLSG